MKIIKINKRKIGSKHPPFLIAEVGINHNGSLNKALKMVEIAKKAGVDAVKFQTFKAEEFISNNSTKYTYFSRGKKVTEPMYNMFKRYELSENALVKIKKKCKEKNLIFFSTPQNYSDLKVLLKIGVPVIKVGSDDFTNIPLIKSYSKTNLPLILSSGMANLKEIKDTLRSINYKNYPVILMLCVSQYPTPLQDVNLLRLKELRKKFPSLILGFSDHTIGPIAGTVAASLGAVCFEKHFTISNKESGPDHWFSESPKNLKIWVDSIKSAYKALGRSKITPTKKENNMKLLLRRSIVASKNIAKDEKINIKNLTYKRPGNGIEPSKINEILGLRAKRPIKKNQQIRKALLKK